MKKVSIIGLGWIGLPLANHLKSLGIEVVGSTTSLDKLSRIQSEGIPAVHFELNPFPQGKGFQALFQAEVLIVNIPPRSRTQGPDFYLEQLKFLRSMIDQSPIKKVIFVSSTGIYPEMPREEEYSEDFTLSLENCGNQTLLKAEQMMEKDRNFDLAIVRFGGLMGGERIPGKYFAGKENVAGHTRVNFIHRNDAVGILAWIIENEFWNEVFNGVAPIHSLRKEIYERNHQDLGFPLPASYQPAKAGEDRLISGKKILEASFQFEYPDPLDFKYQS
ncbi:MAG: epimerase [Algoriphagus sp.]|nr:epimerase [Algoriphagus sp.]